MSANTSSRARARKVLVLYIAEGAVIKRAAEGRLNDQVAALARGTIERFVVTQHRRGPRRTHIASHDAMSAAACRGPGGGVAAVPLV
jgi:hypothetical protein